MSSFDSTRNCECRKGKAISIKEAGLLKDPPRNVRIIELITAACVAYVLNRQPERLQVEGARLP